MFLRIIGALWLFAVLAACSEGAHRAPAQAATAAPANASDSFLEGPARRVRSRSLNFPLEFTLPNKDNWQITDGPTWLVARHRATGSELALRTWRAERLVRRADCAAEARLARPSLPAIDPETLIERRPLTAPAGFDTELSVGVGATGRGISGYALVIGASVGCCYAAEFTTEATGPAAEREVATRLALTVDRILSRVRLRSVDERAPRRRLISMPSATPE